jgi:hypothetical protein
MSRIGSFARRRKITTAFLVILGLLFVAIAYRAKGPYRFYRADVVLPASGAVAPSGPLLVGVAMRDITPDLETYDPWSDADGDGRYRPKNGDTYEDRNGNGRFDAVWMAGFNNDRPAQSVNDPLWARAIAFRNNGVTVAMVTLDSIGIFHEKFIAIRKAIDPAVDVDHIMFSCSHNHEAPDTMGLWSNGIPPQFDHGYMALVQQACKEAVEEAVAKLQPAEAILAEVVAGPEGFVDDSRKPEVYDNTVRLARFVKPGSDETIATFMVWGNHVETAGSDITALTSDFAHYWREGVESGVPEPNGVEGLGGMALYFQGQVGGLMTQLHTTVPHRDGSTSFREDSIEKAEHLGYNLAILSVNALRGPDARPMTGTQVTAIAKTIFVPTKPLFNLVAASGLLHPGWYWGKVKSELNAYRIGDIEILTIPGELYPEIGEGGITTPEGADYDIEPLEVPPLRSQMQGDMNLIIGLANDMLGYIVPKSQWDQEKPYAYGRTDKPQYGEVNSFGPDVAQTIHSESLALLELLPRQ